MSYRATLFAAVLSLCLGSLAAAGTLTITERESSAGNSLFAGSAGAVDQSDASDNTAALTGAFSFGDSNSVAITEANPFSNGAASASGSISAADNVVQSSLSTLSVTASRVANGTANHFSGTGSAFSRQSQEVRVRFTVNGDDAMYTLTGSFDPGIITTLIGEAHSVRLYRPFTANVLVDVDTAATLNESGLLLAGLTYELRIRVNDRNAASADSPSATDASNFNLQFNVVSVPEPSTGLLACLGGAFFFAIRRRSKAA